ncbi:MAG: YopX family protein, partial [Treponema sp.]|nr:YopX family protein [Treponema sp.]
VIPETVGQFTGLKDKKGVKIFEGDIVDYFKADGKPYRGFIKYYEDGFDIRREGTIDCSLRGISSRCIEVIGNIHDNQELLKEARNDIY